MENNQKEYIALMGFEMSTDTDDITGTVKERFSDVLIDESRLKQWFEDHKGWTNQIPPDYCAQKHQGKPLYKLKRAQQEVNPRPKEVFLEESEILDLGPDWANVRIVCSRGTYIRSIARDLGSFLGFGGYLKELRRLRSEGFGLDQAWTLDALTEKGEEAVIPLLDALQIPKARVTKAGEAGIQDGQPIQISWVKDDVIAPEGTNVALLNMERDLLCIARVQRERGLWGYIERGFRH
jgi:tRNA pseudouridine55 synthase